MLSISTLPEALAFLSEKTHHQWLEAELFDLVSRLGIRINAVAPSDAQTTIQTFEIGKGLIEKFRLPPGHSLLAVLFPFQTAELWQRGETKTSHPSDWNQIEGEDKLFLEPVRVTSADVRIRGESLAKILGAWNEAQEGGMWVSSFPKWMHPENEKLLQTDPNKAEPETPAASSGAPKDAKPTSNENSTQSVTTHKIETRTNALTAVISTAIKNALCPNDAHSIWAAFVAMAEAQNRPYPLLGYVETEGVKYQDESGVAFITKENFLRRVRRKLTNKNR